MPERFLVAQDSPRCTLVETAVLATLHSIDGLIAWARREDWRDALADIYQRHAAKACKAAGVPTDELAEVLGDHAATVTWGAAFEDLLATVLPDGSNLADEYLRRRGWKETASTRDYVSGLRHAVISLYEVSGLVPGESMLLRDLVRPGEPVRVFERSGSRSLRQWDRIATRIIPIRTGAVISGTLMAFDRATSEAMLASLRRVAKRLPAETARMASELGVATEVAEVASVLTPEMLLALSAPMFTTFWLDAAFKSARGENRPQLLNSDGEPLDLLTLHFPLLPGVTADQIRQALARLPALRRETATFWNWLSADKPQGQGPTKGRRLTTTMDDGALVLGNVELKGRRLSLSVNSATRAKRGQAMLEAALAGLVRAPTTERTDLEQLLAEQRGRPAPASGLPPEQELALLQQTLDDHYRRVLDEPIPALGNRSSRAAVRTAKGREKVVGWLKLLENHSGNLDGSTPMASYDFGWLWRELGVEEFRR